MLELEAKVNLVLPCPVDTFKRQSVSFAGPSGSSVSIMSSRTPRELIAKSRGFRAGENDPTSTIGLV